MTSPSPTTSETRPAMGRRAGSVRAPLRSDGTREATHRHWFRLPRDLGDDPHLHDGAARLRHRLDRHRRAAAAPRRRHDRHDQPRPRRLVPSAGRADEWLLQDVQSLVNAGGRGTLRGVIRDTRRPDRGVDGPGDDPAPGRADRRTRSPSGERHCGRVPVVRRKRQIAVTRRPWHDEHSHGSSNPSGALTGRPQ